MYNFNDLISACNNKWGGIQGLMTSEFGYVIAQQGDDAKMVCPNHTSEANNHGGNCHASNSKGVWQCFSCGEGGGYLDLVMINKNMTKAEAIRWLAEETGFSLGVSQERSPKDVRQAFVRLCHQNLMDGIAKKDARYLLAETYLRNRGMSAKTIKKFSVGFCVRHGNEISQMKKLGYTGEEMEKAHILRTSKKGQKYCALGNRVIVMAGDNIYGRDIAPDSNFKHYYTSSKHKLFGKNAAGFKHRKIVFVVEAVLDAMAVQQFIDLLQENWAVVSTYGTGGIGNEELVKDLVKINPDEVIVIPDSDPWLKNGRPHGVGQKKGLEKADAIQKAGISTRIMVLPEGKDPCDLTKDGLPEQDFRQLVELRTMFPERYAIYSLARTSGNIKASYDTKKRFLNGVKNILAFRKISLRKEMVEWLSRVVEMDEPEIYDVLRNSFDQASVLAYFARCWAAGKTDEEIVAHIRKLAK